MTFFRRFALTLKYLEEYQLSNFTDVVEETIYGLFYTLSHPLSVA